MAELARLSEYETQQAVERKGGSILETGRSNATCTGGLAGLQIESDQQTSRRYERIRDSAELIPPPP